MAKRNTGSGDVNITVTNPFWEGEFEQKTTEWSIDLSIVTSMIGVCINKRMSEYESVQKGALKLKGTADGGVKKYILITKTIFVAINIVIEKMVAAVTKFVIFVSDNRLN